MASPCGAGDARGSTAQGVTDTQITIGYGDDAGYDLAPGLNKEMSDAIEAMIDWCNDQGGINGRSVVGHYGDAAIVNVNAVIAEACRTDFMLVGEGWSRDSAQEQTRLACGLPAVPTFSVSVQFSNAPLMYQPMPNPADHYNAANAWLFAQRYPDAVRKAATFGSSYPATAEATERAVIAYAQAGWTFLDCSQQYNIGGEADWTPFVRRLKACGVEVVHFSGSPEPNFENILDAASAIDYDPMWMVDSNFYDPGLARWNVSHKADNVFVRMVYFPFEQAAQVPAVQQYLDIVRANGGSVSLLGEQATAAFLLWAQAATSCGSNLTRDCVTTALAKVDNFDAGGLQSPTNPGANMPGDCAMVLRLNGTRYEQVLPTTLGTQACDPKYLVKLTGPVVERARLDADRISRAGTS